MKRHKIFNYAGSLVLALIATAVSAQAGIDPTHLTADQLARQAKLKPIFDKINKTSKGPYGKNVLQGSKSWVYYSEGASPSGKRLFDAAYRSDDAVQLANEGLYLGNRFSTNYYEVYGKHAGITDEEKRRRAYDVSPEKLLPKTEALAEMKLMAKHTILELYYIAKFPHTNINKGYYSRGTAGTEWETPFFGHFTGYLAHHISTPEDYLLSYELQRKVNLNGDDNDVSLSKLRSAVAGLETSVAGSGSFDKNQKLNFNKIRNNIHSLMTPGVILMLENFISKNSSGLKSSGLASKVNSLLEDVKKYYQVTKTSLVAVSQEVSTYLPATLTSLIANLANHGNTLENIMGLSQHLAEMRPVFLSKQDPKILEFMVKGVNFANAELSRLPEGSDSLGKAYALANLSYAVGALSDDEYRQLIPVIEQNLGTVLTDAASSSIANVVNNAARLAHRHYDATFEPAYSDWVLVESGMSDFLDDALRSSPIASLALVVAEMKVGGHDRSEAKPYTIMNPGETIGKLVYITQEDLLTNSTKWKSVDRTTIVVFEKLPIDVGAVAGVITEENQTALSHINIKISQRLSPDGKADTPNVVYPNASQSDLFRTLIEKGALVRLSSVNDTVTVEEVTLEVAQAFWDSRRTQRKISLQADLSERQIRSTSTMSQQNGDVLRYGAKATNYGELTHALGEEVTPSGFGVPFFYYQEFIETNGLKQEIDQMLADPKFHSDRLYTEERLTALREKIRSDAMVVNPDLVTLIEEAIEAERPDTLGLKAIYRELDLLKDDIDVNEKGSYADRFLAQLSILRRALSARNKKHAATLSTVNEAISLVTKAVNEGDSTISKKLVKRVQDAIEPLQPNRMRFRSSTNSEDLDGFTGAGLYDSTAYTPGDTTKTIPYALKLVWSSVWNLRAYDEREYAGINHADVSAAVLISPSYPTELANGVAITRNVVTPEGQPALYINVQIGEEAVTNPNPGITPEQILIFYDPDLRHPERHFTVSRLEPSSIAAGREIMSDAELKVLGKHLLKAHFHFLDIFKEKQGRDGGSVDLSRWESQFAIDSEFKVDLSPKGERAIFIKQARPYSGK